MNSRMPTSAGEVGILNVGDGDTKQISRKLALAKYRRSDKNTAVQERYRATTAGKASRRATEARYAAANREKRNAKAAVAHAIRRGRVPPARMFPCFDCLANADHFHHPSYAREDRLKLVPLCSGCHHDRHTAGQAQAVETLGALRGWVRRDVIGHERIPDRFGRQGYAGITILRLSCGHSRSQRGSAAVPESALCHLCAANQHPPHRPEAGL